METETETRAIKIDKSLVLWAKINITGRNASHEMNQLVHGMYGCFECWNLARINKDQDEKAYWFEKFTKTENRLKELVKNRKIELAKGH